MDETLRLILSAVLSAVLGSILGSGALYKIVVSALENHFGKMYLSQKDATGMSHRFSETVATLRDKADRNTNLFVRLDDRLGEAEATLAVIAERQSQQHERFGEQLVQTAKIVEGVTNKLEKVAGTTQELAVQLAVLKKNG